MPRWLAQFAGKLRLLESLQPEAVFPKIISAIQIARLPGK